MKHGRRRRRVNFGLRISDCGFKKQKKTKKDGETEIRGQRSEIRDQRTERRLEIVDCGLMKGAGCKV
jgi:hypothetical protein